MSAGFSASCACATGPRRSSAPTSRDWSCRAPASRASLGTSPPRTAGGNLTLPIRASRPNPDCERRTEYPSASFRLQPPTTDGATHSGAICARPLSPCPRQHDLEPLWQHRIERWAPVNAGLAIQATRNLGTLPIGPRAGLGALAAWAAAALLAGGVLQR